MEVITENISRVTSCKASPPAPSFLKHKWPQDVKLDVWRSADANIKLPMCCCSQIRYWSTHVLRSYFWFASSLALLVCVLCSFCCLPGRCRPLWNELRSQLSVVSLHLSAVFVHACATTNNINLRTLLKRCERIHGHTPTLGKQTN